MMKAYTLLEKLAENLQKNGLDAAVFPAHEDPLLPRLLVYLGHDRQELERIVEINLREQIIDAQLLNEESKGPYYRAQFAVELPLEIKEGTSGQLSSFLAFLNQHLELTGFELNELTGKISFRHMFLTNKQGIDPIICRAILGTILLTLDLYTQPLERLALGTITFNALLEETLTLLKKATK